ncbi:MAG: sulfatase-like hydrolase/transferase [Phycisphaerae bacterium]|nr:sulfatase-like hydrolase/transferase [Phycisphaerae bacterium]
MKKKTRWFIIIILLIALVLAAIALACYRPTRWSLDMPTAITGPFSEEQKEALAETIEHVVLISIDTCRADHLSCYNYSRKTSLNIDAVAAESVLFNHAVSPVPITLPAHSSMMTGTIPPYHKVRDNDNYVLDPSNITLAEILKEKGFTTGAVLGSFVMDSQFGLDQGFDVYEDHLEGKGTKAEVFYNERKAPEITRLGAAWLEAHKDEKTFLFLHYYDPHAPYIKHRRLTPPLAKQCYDDEIFYTDYFIGKVIAKLKELEMYDSTLVIITGDHGESLGDHGETSHGFFIYHSTLHVPLIIRVPGGPKGLVNETVGLIDIVPTVCGLLGIDIPGIIQGRDLSEYFSNDPGRKDSTEHFYYCESLMPTKLEMGPLFGLISDPWKYIHSSEPELYDLKKNPHEKENVLDNNTQRTRIMQHALKNIIEDDFFNTTVASQSMLDETDRQRLQSLGYVAGETKDKNIQFEQTSVNPKELIDVYNFWEKALTYIADKKYEKAKKLCYKMLEERPGMKQAHFSLGTIAIFQQDIQGAITHYSAYLKDENLDDTPENLQKKPEYAAVHSNLGAAIAREGNLNKAKEHYQKALLYNPHYVKANYNLAGIYFRQGNLTEAISLLTKVLEIDPEMPEANQIMGDIRFKQGRFDEAIEHYQTVLEMRPDFEPVLKGLSMAKEKLAKNAAQLETSLAKNPNQPVLHNQLSALYWQKGDAEKALLHWKQSVSILPDQPLILNNLAWILSVYPDEDFHTPQEAVKHAEKACELTNQKEPELLDTLSIAYAAAGDFAKAIKTAEKALALEPANKEILKRLDLFNAGKAYSEKR